MKREIRKQLRDVNSIQEMFDVLTQHYDLSQKKDRKIIHKVAAYMPDFIRIADLKEKQLV